MGRTPECREKKGLPQISAFYDSSIRIDKQFEAFQISIVSLPFIVAVEIFYDNQIHFGAIKNEWNV